MFRSSVRKPRFLSVSLEVVGISTHIGIGT